MNAMNSDSVADSVADTLLIESAQLHNKILLLSFGTFKHDKNYEQLHRILKKSMKRRERRFTNVLLELYLNVHD